MSSSELLVQEAPNGVPAGDARLRRIAARLNVALTGAVEAGEKPSIDCAQSPAFAAAFGPDSRGEVVEVGSGLWTVKRVSGDGDLRVLCVFNLTGAPRSFIPETHLRAAPLQFITGDVDTYSTPENELACRLQPYRDVWLGAATGVERA
ncbi:hypothetical protein ACH347_34445 [Saccharopolyspora sp. 5N102]|uniref:hypothetical protein n=1 Tax=Saccharopolyspora sp. 5N102 TaxID=3375155 RepID=UPI00378CB5A2